MKKVYIVRRCYDSYDSDIIGIADSKISVDIMIETHRAKLYKDSNNKHLLSYGDEIPSYTDYSIETMIINELKKDI